VLLVCVSHCCAPDPFLCTGGLFFVTTTDGSLWFVAAGALLLMGACDVVGFGWACVLPAFTLGGLAGGLLLGFALLLDAGLLPTLPLWILCLMPGHGLALYASLMPFPCPVMWDGVM